MSPIYEYEYLDTSSNETVELLRPYADRDSPLPDGRPARRLISRTVTHGLNLKLDWQLGVHPSQIDEAKKLTPSFEFASNGQAIYRSAQHREKCWAEYAKAMGHAEPASSAPLNPKKTRKDRKPPKRAIVKRL